MAQRAFTLIEIIIAVIVLAILSATIVPRIQRAVGAEHEVAVERVQDLLAMYAFRDATSSQQIALWQDPETGWLLLRVADRDPNATSEDGDASKFEWIDDPSTQPVALPRGMELVDLMVDGSDVLGTDWLIPTVPGGGRPSIEMHLVSGSVDTLLRLDSNSVVPIRLDANSPPITVRESEDLDAYGTRGEKW